MTAKQQKPLLKYKVKFPDGSETTRKSYRKYTHAVICYDDKRLDWFCAGYCGSYELARKLCNTWSRRDYHCRIVELELFGKTLCSNDTHGFQPEGSESTSINPVVTGGERPTHDSPEKTGETP